VRHRRWLRYDWRVGSWLALFVLGLQLVVSFGHVHIDAVQRDYPGLATGGSGTHTVKQLPAQQPSQDSDDYCAICASIYLAANSFVPVAPQLPVPSVSHLIERFDRGAAVFVAARRLAFQSRAPPLA
jgi:hypothetical protein